MIVALCILLATPCPASSFGLATSSDTIRLEVGSKEVNGRVYAPHAARVRVHVGSLDTRPTAEWTNELTLGDSAGRRVIRWVTKGTRTAPSWSPAIRKSEPRIFTVLGEVSVKVEGADVKSWKVEERQYAVRQLLATWYLVDESPYMVYGEVPLPNGQIQRMTEVAIPMSGGRP